MKNHKIIYLALGLLILAGIIVVCLKGFNVDYMLKEHNSIEYSIEGEFNKKDVEDICSTVFDSKKFKVKVVGLFDDAVSVNAEQITTEEADKLVKALDEKYKTVEKVEESTEATAESEEKTPETEEAIESHLIITNPKIKLNTLFKPYVLPIIISAVIILAYAGIRFSALGSMKVIIKLIGLELITTLSILSVLAIVRFPINTLVIPIIMIVSLLELSIFFERRERELKKD